ncbi:MAG: IS5 family transposase [Pseudomonadota bacterium]
MAKRYELTLSQWAKIEPLLPGKSSDPGRSGTDNRLFVKGVLWILRSGAHWCDLPERYGTRKTVHKRFTRWAEASVWERVFAHLIEDPDNSYVSLDSSLVRAHQQAATGKGSKRRDQALGRSRGGLTTKIHLATDAVGRPLRVIMTPGQRGDAPIAPALLHGLSPQRVLADKANDSNALRALIASMQAEPVIPCNPTRKQLIPYDFEAYMVRNTVERCFNKLKYFRRIATRFDRRAVYFLSFVHLAATMLWMR